ncbi:MAG: tRNA (adenosine(37)-N6)-threonylcarbamoyltransferase complex dimerization subunit type 1 TsaB [Actinobacteria bacterium]|nr:tRNA (adenosine(37)-N6)-threonylcarbamoyltransferase complex dimerization subunit type 1 TsaB [Actinomycetota bacterium]
MNILGIDSSTKKMTVAVSIDGRLVSEVPDLTSRRHMINIIRNLNLTLKRACIKIDDIDCFGVNVGPGDFTGTRIGISVIKTFAMIRKRPAYGFNSLDLYALGLACLNKGLLYRSLIRKRPVVLMPCLDVKRQELYFSFYGVSRVQEKNACFKENTGVGSGSEKGGFINNADYEVAIINIRGKGFLLRRICGYILIGKDDFLNRACSIIKNEIPDAMDVMVAGAGGDSFYGFESYEKEDKAGNVSGIRAEEEQSHIFNTFGVREPVIISGGNCFLEYGSLMESLSSVYRGLLMEKRCIYPEARYINMGVSFRAGKNMVPGNPVPVYVREFVPFGK